MENIEMITVPKEQFEKLVQTVDDHTKRLKELEEKYDEINTDIIELMRKCNMNL